MPKMRSIGRAQLEAYLETKAPGLWCLLIEHEKRALEAGDYNDDDTWGKATMEDLLNIGISRIMANNLLNALCPNYTGVGSQL